MTDTDKPLQDIGVLVTRPAHQSERLCGLIEAEGGRPICFPVLEILDPQDSSPFLAIIERLDQFDIAIFISANAVTKAMNGILARRSLPAHVKLATVGKGSARELERLGLQVDICPAGRFNSEALLEVPDLQDVAGKRIVIFRGEGGRELLADTLKDRGALVEYAEVYRRAQPQSDVSDLLRRWARGEIAVAIVTSNEGLRNLFDILGKLGQQWLRNTQLVVVSERTAELSHELGLKYPAIVAEQASDEALVQAILRWRDGLQRLQADS
jgi:uroporphyrinogen-III synthase